MRMFFIDFIKRRKGKEKRGGGRKKNRETERET